MITVETGIYRNQYRDRKTGEIKTSPYLSISYYDANGKQVRESTRPHKSLTYARRLRRKRQEESEAGMLSGPELKKVSFEDLVEGLREHYVVNELRSWDRVEDSLRHLRQFFGRMKATAITARKIKRYTAGRKADGGGNNTINNELTALRSMLRLAHDEERLARVPKIELLEEPPAREGFVRLPGFLAIVKAMIEEGFRAHVGWLKVKYYTGWRKTTVFQLEWSDVREGWLYAPGLKTKNKKPVRRKLTGPLGDAVVSQRAYVDEVQKRTGKIIPHMFCYPNGRQIKDPGDAWKRATKKAGFEGLWIKDLDRSTWQLMVNAGIPEKDIMDAVGRKTRSIADRYNITDEERLAAVDDRLSEVVDGVEPEEKVRALAGGK
jgi:hypothetical protein